MTTGSILLWTLLVIAGVFAKALWFPHPSVVRGDFASIERYLVQELGDAANDKRLGSAALALLHDGKIAAEHGFGIANAETQAPVKTDQTLYRVASVSKAVTAWGVMKLVEEGKLSLDEPVMHHLTRWRFPGSEEYRDKVTVRHLLGHTAGLDDGLGYGGFYQASTCRAWKNLSGMVMMISGGRGAGNKLADDWIYWETGKVTFEARRQTVYRLVGPASVAIIVGAGVIMLWIRFR